MSQSARKLLGATEKDARAKILSEFQQLQIRMKKRFATLILQIDVAKKSGEPVPVGWLFERSRLATLLSDLQNEITAISGSLAAIVTAAETDAVVIAADTFNEYINTHSAAGQIVRFNPEAAKQLIGNTQNHTPLKAMMSNLSDPVSLMVKNALIDGVAGGLGAREISRQLNTALGTGAAHALQIARTETNNAYRQASLSHYKANKEIVKGWQWLSSLGLRACVICWSRHGKKYPLDKKPNSHVSCRCTVIPVLLDVPAIATGEEKFKELTKPQKIGILGEKRFQLYVAGLDLSDFIGEKATSFGKAPYIKPLFELPDPKGKKPVKITVAKPKPAPKPVPVKPVTMTAEQAMIRLRELQEAGKIKYQQLREAVKRTEAAYYGGASGDRGKLRQAMDDAGSELLAHADKQLELLRDVVRVSNPTNVKYDLRSRTFTAQEKANLAKGLAEFNALVSDQFLKDVTFGVKRLPNRRKNGWTYKGRAFYLDKQLSLGINEEITTMIHETAHGLEQLNPDILDAAVRFYEHRTKGEPFIKLSKLTGNSNYRADEVAKKDKFLEPYDGKKPYVERRGKWNPVTRQYENITEKIVATEIVTRGMEYLWQNPAQFASEQPEYFDFIYKILRGQKWQPK